MTLNIGFEPDPDVLSWSARPGTLQVTVTNTTANSYQYKFDGRMTLNGNVVMQNDPAKMPVESIGPFESQIAFVEDVLPPAAVTLSGVLQDAYVRTGAAPGGQYLICARIVDLQGVELAPDYCQSFLMTSYQQPTAIAPAQTEVPIAMRPLFVWSPVQPTPASFSVIYRLRVVEVPENLGTRAAAAPDLIEYEFVTDAQIFYPEDRRITGVWQKKSSQKSTTSTRSSSISSQISTEAMRAVNYGFPLIDVELVGETQFLWPPDAPDPEAGKSYVWIVQALRDNSGQPVGDNLGLSQPVEFRMGEDVAARAARLGLKSPDFIVSDENGCLYGCTTGGIWEPFDCPTNRAFSNPQALPETFLIAATGTENPEIEQSWAVVDKKGPALQFGDAPPKPDVSKFTLANRSVDAPTPPTIKMDKWDCWKVYDGQLGHYHVRCQWVEDAKTNVPTGGQSSEGRNIEITFKPVALENKEAKQPELPLAQIEPFLGKEKLAAPVFLSLGADGKLSKANSAAECAGAYCLTVSESEGSTQTDSEESATTRKWVWICERIPYPDGYCYPELRRQAAVSSPTSADAFFDGIEKGNIALRMADGKQFCLNPDGIFGPCDGAMPSKEEIKRVNAETTAARTAAAVDGWHGHQGWYDPYCPQCQKAKAALEAYSAAHGHKGIYDETCSLCQNKAKTSCPVTIKPDINKITIYGMTGNVIVTVKNLGTGLDIPGSPFFLTSPASPFTFSNLSTGLYQVIVVFYALPTYDVTCYKLAVCMVNGISSPGPGSGGSSQISARTSSPACPVTISPGINQATFSGLTGNVILAVVDVATGIEIPGSPFNPTSPTFTIPNLTARKYEFVVAFYTLPALKLICLTHDFFTVNGISKPKPDPTSGGFTGIAPSDGTHGHEGSYDPQCPLCQKAKAALEAFNDAHGHAGLFDPKCSICQGELKNFPICPITVTPGLCQLTISGLVWPYTLMVTNTTTGVIYGVGSNTPTVTLPNLPNGNYFVRVLQYTSVGQQMRLSCAFDLMAAVSNCGIISEKPRAAMPGEQDCSKNFRQANDVPCRYYCIAPDGDATEVSTFNSCCSDEKHLTSCTFITVGPGNNGGNLQTAKSALPAPDPAKLKAALKTAPKDRAVLYFEQKKSGDIVWLDKCSDAPVGSTVIRIEMSEPSPVETEWVDVPVSTRAVCCLHNGVLSADVSDCSKCKRGECYKHKSATFHMPSCEDRKKDPARRAIPALPALSGEKMAAIGKIAGLPTTILMSQNPATGELKSIAKKEDCPVGHFLIELENSEATAAVEEVEWTSVVPSTKLFICVAGDNGGVLLMSDCKRCYPLGGECFKIRSTSFLQPAGVRVAAKRCRYCTASPPEDCPDHDQPLLYAVALPDADQKGGLRAVPPQPALTDEKLKTALAGRSKTVGPIFLSQNPTTGDLQKIGGAQDCPRGHFLIELENSEAAAPEVEQVEWTSIVQTTKIFNCFPAEGGVSLVYDCKKCKQAGGSCFQIRSTSFLQPAGVRVAAKWCPYCNANHRVNCPDHDWPLLYAVALLDKDQKGGRRAVPPQPALTDEKLKTALAGRPKTGGPIFLSQNPTTGDLQKIGGADDCPRGHFLIELENSEAAAPVVEQVEWTSVGQSAKTFICFTREDGVQLMPDCKKCVQVDGLCYNIRSTAFHSAGSRSAASPPSQPEISTENFASLYKDITEKGIKSALIAQNPATGELNLIEKAQDCPPGFFLIEFEAAIDKK